MSPSLLNDDRGRSTRVMKMGYGGWDHNDDGDDDDDNGGDECGGDECGGDQCGGDW